MRSRVIWIQVPPHPIPLESAICSKGRDPSIAAASSITASLINCTDIFLIARTARSPAEPSPPPRPLPGKTAPGFKNSVKCLRACAYSTGRCCRNQFVLPANCWTCCFVRSGAKSLTAWALSSSPATPVRDTTRPRRLPSATMIFAFSDPNENPATMLTSKKASKLTKWSRICHGTLLWRSSRSCRSAS